MDYRVFFLCLYKMEGKLVFFAIQTGIKEIKSGSSLQISSCTLILTKFAVGFSSKTNWCGAGTGEETEMKMSGLRLNSIKLKSDVSFKVAVSNELERCLQQCRILKEVQTPSFLQVYKLLPHACTKLYSKLLSCQVILCSI